MFDGKKLKRLRESNRYSQTSLSKEISKKKKVTQAQICHHENGDKQPPFSLVCAYADFFNVSVDDFRGDTQ